MAKTKTRQGFSQRSLKELGPLDSLWRLNEFTVQAVTQNEAQLTAHTQGQYAKKHERGKLSGKVCSLSGAWDLGSRLKV